MADVLSRAFVGLLLFAVVHVVMVIKSGSGSRSVP
jgi:hypothetical protein